MTSSQPDRAGSLRKLLPEHEISVRGSGEALRIRIGPAAQLSCGVASFFLLLWMTIATAVTLSKVFEPPQPAACGEAPAGGGTAADRESAAAQMDSVRILEQQVAAALELATIAHEDRIQVERAMAGLRRTTASPDARPGDDGGEVVHLLDTLEAAVGNLTAAREELRALKEENSALTDAAEANRVKTRRAIARLTGAMTLASEGLESMFRNLGVNPDHLKHEVRSAYSGSGGLAVFINDAAAEADADSWLRESDMRAALDAIDSLNVSKLAHQALPIGHPVKRASRFTSGFGMRMHPIHKRRDFHAGADFAAPKGTPIYATGNGVVTFAGWKTAYGKTVIVRHADGVETLYAHLSRIRVKRGERVWRSQHIADMGSTGLSTASHLHYEVRVGGQAVNPMKFIMAEKNVH